MLFQTRHHHKYREHGPFRYEHRGRNATLRTYTYVFEINWYIGCDSIPECPALRYDGIDGFSYNTLLEDENASYTSNLWGFLYKVED